MTIHVATLTGLVDLEHIRPGDITIDAMAHGLGKIDRWAGALEMPFYVAQHSVLVMEIFRKLRPDLARFTIYPLLHDAHEYLIGDIITPAIKLLSREDEMFGIRLGFRKAELDTVIREALGVAPPPEAVSVPITAADVIAADLEWKALMPAANGPSPYAEVTARNRFTAAVRPKPLPWTAAVDLFKATLTRELAARAWEKSA